MLKSGQSSDGAERVKSNAGNSPALYHQNAWNSRANFSFVIE